MSTILGPYLDPLAIALVGGGTMLAAILRAPGSDVVRAGRAVRVVCAGGLFRVWAAVP